MHSSSENESQESLLTAEPPLVSQVPSVLFGATILLSAFLLFQVQPLIAKLILPWFGGSAAVWTACMLFFQLALLAGYAYAHWLNKRGPTQTYVHLGLLALSLLTLPIVPNAWWKPTGPQDPLLRILGLLAACVGLPYFLLSSTSPLLQSWYARSRGGALPYRFFALSNAGSMLGLLTYPVLVEPNLTNRQQAWMWSGAYALFVLVCGTVAYKSRNASVNVDEPAIRAFAAGPSWPDRFVWMGLAACASALLLAVTNHITQNVAAIPFLWVLPLSLYLLSFILCFDSDRWYNRWLFTRMAAGALPALAYAISGQSNISGLKLAVGVFCALLFVIFMVCHGELARRRPAAAYLTEFYLMVSIGGAAGGLLIGFAAPYLFNGLYDLPVVISLTSLLLLCLLWGAKSAELEDWTALFAMCSIVAIGTIGWMAKDTYDLNKGARLLVRNFYGALRVSDHASDGKKGPVRRLTHGTIDHGEQFLWPQNQRIATTYYSEKSGVGVAIHALQMSGPLHVGVIGLGAGTLTTYGRPIDRYRIYDINPLVLEIANKQFTFLTHCMAQKTVVLGDARLSLEREPPQGFDLLAVDAFSGDAIPVHLLTREAMALYWRHLKPDGVLAVHVSNKFLELGPVVKQLAELEGKKSTLVANEDSDEDEISLADWVLVTTRPGFLDLPEVKAGAQPVGLKPGQRPWTDDYSNLYQILLH